MNVLQGAQVFLQTLWWKFLMWLTSESVGWVKQIQLSTRVDIIQSAEGLYKRKSLTFLQVRGNFCMAAELGCQCSPAFKLRLKHRLFLSLQAYGPQFMASPLLVLRSLNSEWNSTISSHRPPICLLQILGLLGHHDPMNQSLIIHLFLYKYTSCWSGFSGEPWLTHWQIVTWYGCIWKWVKGIGMDVHISRIRNFTLRFDNSFFFSPIICFQTDVAFVAFGSILACISLFTPVCNLCFSHLWLLLACSITWTPPPPPT